ncbi:MAG: hypothetical protein ABH867_04855 [Patescibacteria group bacterium]|nr:hypothetical protein [Patescibacteria group bacterium]
MVYKKIAKFWGLILFIFSVLISVRFFVFWEGFNLDFNPSPLPLIEEDASFPQINAKSAIIIDADSGTVLFEREPHLRLNPASITKMATAITALETYPVDEVVSVISAYPVGKIMGLKPEEKITVKNLIYGLLVHSANDAAFVLAGQTEGKIAKFIARMNEIAFQENLNDTHFVNFDGEEDQNHYSTVFDLAHLTRWALRNSIFSDAVRLDRITVTDITGNISHDLETTNELLGLEEIKGVKTGWTPLSGECFVGLVDLEDRRLITVVLGSEDRFGETKKLVDWAKENIFWKEI